MAMSNYFPCHVLLFCFYPVLLLSIVLEVDSIDINNVTSPEIIKNGNFSGHIGKVESNSTFSSLLSGVNVMMFASHSNISRQKKNETWPCVNQCRYTDQSLNDCWENSLKYHASELLKKAQDLYSALLHVDHWKRLNLENNDPELTSQNFEIATLLGVLSSDDENDDESSLDVKVNGTVQKIFEMIFKEFQSKKDRFHADEESQDDVPPLPSLTCPVTCDYYPKMWVILAAILSLALMMLIVAVLLYLFYDSWSPRYRGKWRPVYN